MATKRPIPKELRTKRYIPKEPSTYEDLLAEALATGFKDGVKRAHLECRPLIEEFEVRVSETLQALYRATPVNSLTEKRARKAFKKKRVRPRIDPDAAPPMPRAKKRRMRADKRLCP